MRVSRLGVGTAVLGLKLPRERIDRSFDYVGAMLMIGAVTALLLVSVWGVEQYPWGSPEIIGLAVVFVVLSALFVLQEHRAAEPILALCLHGSTAVASGLVTASLTGGSSRCPSTRAAASASSARPHVSHGGCGMHLVCATEARASAGLVAKMPGLVLIGAGFRMTMSVMMVAAQNSVPSVDLGVTSSATSFGRSLRLVLGTALQRSLHPQRARRPRPGVAGSRHGDYTGGARAHARHDQRSPARRQASGGRGVRRRDPSVDRCRSAVRARRDRSGDPPAQHPLRDTLVDNTLEDVLEPNLAP